MELTAQTSVTEKLFPLRTQVHNSLVYVSLPLYTLHLISLTVRITIDSETAFCLLGQVIKATTTSPPPHPIQSFMFSETFNGKGKNISQVEEYVSLPTQIGTLKNCFRNEHYIS